MPARIFGIELPFVPPGSAHADKADGLLTPGDENHDDCARKDQRADELV
jgi:hypothetical protein